MAEVRFYQMANFCCFSQASRATIALAVLSIYAVDFAINVGRYSERRVTIFVILIPPSSSLCSKFNRRYITYSFATSWVSMGYVEGLLCMFKYLC